MLPAVGTAWSCSCSPPAPGAAPCAPRIAAKPLGGSNLLQQLKPELLKADHIPGAVTNSTMHGLAALAENSLGAEGPWLAGWAALTQVSPEQSLGTVGRWKGKSRMSPSSNHQLGTQKCSTVYSGLVPHLALACRDADSELFAGGLRSSN